MSPQPTLYRAFTAPQIERTGPRQLTGRLVPYGVATDVADELPDGTVDVYREGFRAGAFSPQANAKGKGVVSKIGLIHRHNGGLGFLGTFSALREEADGLYGDVSVLRSRADDVEDLLTAGVDELSVEFRLAHRDHTAVDDAGVRWRTRAHLDQVALEAKGAYSTAQVLAYRAEVDEDTARAAADAEAAAARREQWEALTGRLDVELERQADYVRRFGITQPGGFKTL